VLLSLVPVYTRALALPSVQQTVTPGCPTYQVNLVVDVVDSTPVNAVAGDIVITRFHVIYEDGTPVTLSPEIASFLWAGSSGEKQFDNVAVTYTGIPGFYNYTQEVTADLVQTVGMGKVTISVVACSCSDGLGNRGPVSLVNSDYTLAPSDNSIIGIETTTTPTQPFNFLVPLLIAILLILALALFLMRSRRKKK